MSDTLDVFRGAKRAGRLRRDEGGLLEFQYDRNWLADADASPISVRLPLRTEAFGDDPCRVFFGNLLPEGATRQMITAKLGISESNDFKLLEVLGGECAGALSIVPEGEAASASGGYEPLSRKDLDRMIEEMPRTPLLLAREDLRLSLAGAQQKIPLFHENGKFFLPHGSFASSHILKPAIPGFEGVVENEAFCMALARQAGLPVPSSTLVAGKHPFYLIERYDRVRGEDGKLVRLHQEDFCQALGYSYGRKYEADGGPGLEACFGLLAEHGTQPALDKMTMLRWVIFNHLIGNCDAHAKNLSMMIGREDYRLSPLYDLLSTRVYGRLSPKYAMRIGKQYRAEWVLKEHWERLAEEAGVGAKAVLELCGEMGESVPELARPLAAAFTEEHGGKETIDTILKNISSLAKKMREALKR
ncbi:MAG: type II toxin-antitoxin system HipA family toxin [Elusimicrobiota bacterium]|nr:type II toxin-antitoxin system HipA family toxin [Elusimicrobiota bacterium]